MASAFVPLHTHSSHSPMQGVPTLEALCQAVRAQGHDTLALTDTNGLYGAIRFLDVARATGLKPILGAELIHDSHRAVVLAKTPAGYANLCRVLSARHCDESFDLIGTVARHRAGLVILSDDCTALNAWKHDSGEDLYVELTPGPEMHEAMVFSRRANLPPVATTRANFLQPRDYQVHRLLRAIAENTTLSRLGQDQCCSPTHWLMPGPVLERYFPHVPETLNNTHLIADQCYTDWDFKETIFPSFRQLSSCAAFETLRTKTYDGALWRYRELSDVVRSRIEKELTVIRDKGYADYFLVVDAGELTRPALLWRLFASQAAKAPGYLPIPPEYSRQQTVAHELALFGFPLSCHPLELFNDRLAGIPHITANELPQHVGEQVTVIGWLVTEKIVSTKKGEPMEFVTFEDQSSLYDATLFPQTYGRFCHLLATNQAYVVTGLVEEQFSTVTLTIKELRLLASRAVEDHVQPIEDVVG